MRRLRRYEWAVAVSVVALAAIGIGIATAAAPTITGFPSEIRTVDLSGYVLQTSYSLGANTGFTFQQTYQPGGRVEAHPIPNPGNVHFNSNYVAMPVGNKMLMVTWYLGEGTLTDVFVMNFQTGIVSDVAPNPCPTCPQSLGTVNVLQTGANGIPPP